MNGVILILAIFVGVYTMMTLDRRHPTVVAALGGGAAAALTVLILRLIGALL